VAINPVLHGRIARLYESGSINELQKLVTLGSRASFLIAVIPTGILLLAASPIIEFLYGEGFLSGGTALNILLVGHLCNVGFGPVAALLNMSGHQSITMKVMMFSVLINLALNMSLVQEYGAIGAAASTATSMFIWNFILWVVVKRKIGISSGFLGRVRLGW
jgi:O-antigen/teichoic acid export membrane protein